MADIRLASACVRATDVNPNRQELDNLVTPGDLITSDTGFMRGHGTYMQDDRLHASVAGVVDRVNKLICVRPLKTRYNGEVGDVVVGRIIEVGQRRWKVDTHSKLDSVLMLSSVNLPGGELRRRSEEDEKMMRHYLKEGDLISAEVQSLFMDGSLSLHTRSLKYGKAEVQSLFMDGSLSLHTRSLKYGKLGQGTLVTVSPSLVKRRKTHFHNLPCGAQIILGNNGYIWIAPITGEVAEDSAGGGYEQNLEPVSRIDREVICRMRNCVLALGQNKMMLFDTSILYTYENSLKFSTKELLKPEVMNEIVELTRLRLEQEGF